MGITTSLPALSVLVCILIPALGGTEQKRLQNFVENSTKKYASTTEKIKGSQGHWQQIDLQQIDLQQIEFHWTRKRTQEEELHMDSQTERHTTALYSADIKNVCIADIKNVCILE